MTIDRTIWLGGFDRIGPTAFATEAPRPLDAPVMNRVCVLIVSFFLYVAGFPIGRPASAQASTPTIIEPWSTAIAT
jgi:hypothetical protein